MNEANKEKVLKVLELAVRINEETELCTFINFSGHTDGIEIKVSQSKKEFLKRVHNIEFRINGFDFQDKNEIQNKLSERLDGIISDLKNLLTSKWEHTFTAYCNLIDMACSSVFSSEHEAMRWVKKMEKKYASVHPVCGYTKEARKQ